MPIRAVVWGENVHEQHNKIVAGVYPDGMHQCIADTLNTDPEITATTATLQEPEHGLTKERLAETDVLLWWGHAAHGDVPTKWWNASATPSGPAWAWCFCIRPISPSRSNA